MLYKGNALTKEDHDRDARLIKELGANTIRLAHYRHAQEFYDVCDERGFIVWAEIPFISVFNKDPEAHQNCISQLKELDPTRLTTIAHVTMTPIESPMHGITDVESYNHYFGWYGGKMEDNGPWFDQFHKVHPDICIGVSEYGCERIITYHGPNHACKDYSEE